jgi:hypothetical protein
VGDFTLNSQARSDIASRHGCERVIIAVFNKSDRLCYDKGGNLGVKNAWPMDKVIFLCFFTQIILTAVCNRHPQTKFGK